MKKNTHIQEPTPTTLNELVEKNRCLSSGGNGQGQDTAA
ncbi:MAG: hypothetical protein KHW93_00800 [Butyricicoccus pullicaecorum]|nr:hypothetical protein [Butyricicoccus pullicaecorum]